MDSFLAEWHASVAEASWHVDVDRALDRKGALRDDAIIVPHFAALPRLGAVTDLLGVIPDSESDFFCSQSAVRPFPLPFEVQPVQVSSTHIAASCRGQFVSHASIRPEARPRIGAHRYRKESRVGSGLRALRGRS